MIRKIGIFLEMIKFEHTLFALPFAFVGAILGAVTMEKRLPEWSEIGWIILAMVGARSAAMGLTGSSTMRLSQRIRGQRSGPFQPDCLRLGKWFCSLPLHFVLLVRRRS